MSDDLRVFPNSAITLFKKIELKPNYSLQIVNKLIESLII